MRSIRLTAFLFWLLTLYAAVPVSQVAAARPIRSEESLRSQPGQSQDWIERQTEHFHFRVLRGSAAERDLDFIAAEAEQSLQRVLARLESPFESQLDVYLIDRVFWQGGAAYGDQVLISYLDRNYVDVPLNYYLDHELTHAIAYRLVPEDGNYNSLMAEGLATWITGGHYGPEPIHEMAAALPAMDAYIPFERLLGDFHAEQHEIAYIEAASFVGWLIEQYGLERVKAFYGLSDSPEQFFELSYSELESAWLVWLEQEQGRDAAETEQWWRAQIRLFNTMRAYQATFDPFARELPRDRPEEWNAGQRLLYRENIDSPAAIALESQLIEASETLSCEQDVEATHALLNQILAATDLGGIPAQGILGRKQEIARLLDAQDDALRSWDMARFLAVAAPSTRRPLAYAMLSLMTEGGGRQETARLTVEGAHATALVAWYPFRSSETRAFRFNFTSQAGGWRLTEVAPIATHTLIPRSERLCKS